MFSRPSLNGTCPKQTNHEIELRNTVYIGGKLFKFSIRCKHCSASLKYYVGQEDDD